MTFALRVSKLVQLGALVADANGRTHGEWCCPRDWAPLSVCWSMLAAAQWLWNGRWVSTLTDVCCESLLATGDHLHSLRCLLWNITRVFLHSTLLWHFYMGQYLYFSFHWISETSTVLHDRLLAIAYRCSKWSWLIGMFLVKVMIWCTVRMYL